MTSWFIGVEASVISGAPLYSKSISYLFPIGKRQVLFAKRSYIYRSSGSNPCRGNKKAAGIRQSLFYSMVGRQGFSLLRRRPLRRFRALRAALANAHAFPQLRALSGSNPCTGNKKSDQPESIAFFSMVGRQGFEPWTLGLKVPCSAS